MNANEIITRLLDNGYESFFVGGCVRDLVLGLKPKDYDIVTKARPDEIEELFKDCEVKLVGEQFKTAKVDGIDVATYRKDKYGGLSDKNVVVTYADNIEEDLRRRDFTCNTLIIDPKSNEILDRLGVKEDIENRIIRFVGDAKKRIYDDPNRIIRACRFKAKMNAEFDPETFESLKKYATYVRDYVKHERIKDEIMEAMKIQKASIFFRALNDIGALQYIFPHLAKSDKFFHGKYHEEYVFDHMMYCGDELHPKNKRLKLTGYIHDVGKMITYQDQPDGNRSFIGHDKSGSDYLRTYLVDTLKFSADDADYISKLVRVHMRGIKNMGEKGYRRLLKVLHDYRISYKDLLRLKMADRTANLKKNRYSKTDVKQFIRKYENEINRDKIEPFLKLVIDGNYIMEVSGLSRGRKIGEIKRFLEKCVVKNPKLNNKEKLKQLILLKAFEIIEEEYCKS